jgi:hypothetical protein
MLNYINKDENLKNNKNLLKFIQKNLPKEFDLFQDDLDLVLKWHKLGFILTRNYHRIYISFHLYFLNNIVSNLRQIL